MPKEKKRKKENALIHLTYNEIVWMKNAVSDSLYESFQTIADCNEERASYYNESGKMTISLTASEATIGKDTVKIIAFNDISN